VKCLGHVLRGEGLLGEFIEGKMEGKRLRGRRRMGMLEEVYKKKSYGIMKTKPEDRMLWKSWMP